MQENLQQLNNLARLLGTDRLISKEDMDTLLKSIIEVLANSKKEVQGLNTETKALVNSALNHIIDQTNKSIGEIDLAIKTKKDNIAVDVISEIEKAYSQAAQVKEKSVTDFTKKIKDTTAILNKAQKLLADIQAIEVKDGQDADEEKIVADVLAKIELPQYKETILDDGEQIVEKINELPTDNELFKIDAKHIKGLETGKNGKITGVRTRDVFYYDETTFIGNNIQNIKFQGSGVQASIAADGSLIVTVTGTAGSFADETMTDSGDHTTFTIAHTPNTGTLLVINENTGQAVAKSSYTNTTTSIVFGSSQAQDNGDGTLSTPTFRARYSY